MAKTTLTIRVNPELKARIAEAAAYESRTISQLVNMVLVPYFYPQGRAMPGLRKPAKKSAR